MLQGSDGHIYVCQCGGRLQFYAHNFGQHAAETIFGRGGADLLTGGAGADRISFNFTSDSTVASHDMISDFLHGTDVIYILAISGITGIQGLITSVNTQVAGP